MTTWCRGIVLAAVATLALAGGAAAQSFYDGRTITLVIGGDAGGGYDIYGRALARHIGRHIPGKPIVIAQNRPGAGSINAAEYMFAIAPKDGSTFAIVFPGAIIEPLLGTGPAGNTGAVRYDATRFEYIGTADNGTRVCATFHGSKVRTIADARTYRTVIGATASGGATRDYAIMLNTLAGTLFSVVAGYKGTSDITLALERGEVDGLCGLDWSSLKSQKPDWISAGKLNLLLQIGLEPEAELTAMSVPQLWSVLAGEQRQIAELIVAQQVFGRPFLAPPGIPADRLALLRAAFMATMRDAAFLTDADKIRIQITPLSGEMVQSRVRQLYAAPKAIIDAARLAIKPTGG